MNLVDIAVDLLQIKQMIYQIAQCDHGEYHYNLKTFEQLWGSTTGPFNGVGGCAMTKWRTYVLEPDRNKTHYIIFFGGRFGYRVEKNNENFLKDLENESLASISSAKVRYKK